MTRRRRLPPLLLWAGCGLAALGLVAALAVLEPGGDSRYTICVLRRTTGVPCPGCGLTRALAALAKGRWAAALGFHPLAPLVAAEVAAGWLVWGAVAAGLRTPPSTERVHDLLLANVLALVALWLGRAASGMLPV